MVSENRRSDSLGKVFPSDSLNPGFVEGHPHVDSRQVGVGTLDPMAHLDQDLWLLLKNEEKTLGCAQKWQPQMIEYIWMAGTVPMRSHLPSSPWYISGPPLSPCDHLIEISTFLWSLAPTHLARIFLSFGISSAEERLTNCLLVTWEDHFSEQG